jgi:hypothetical protein
METNMATSSDLMAAKSLMSRRYLTKATTTEFTAFAASAPLKPSQNVVGVGVGTKFSDGKETSTRCVRFYVERKIHRDALSAKDLLPEEIDGVPTDVIATGRFVMQSTADENKKRRRPVRPGVSVGFKFPPPKQGFVMAGTLGAIVQRNGKRFLLSNNHVLAENGLIALGSPIFQPGLLDGGLVATDPVAKLSKMINIKATGFNKVDCAIAEVLATIKTDARPMPSVGALATAQPVAASLGMLVHKTGRTTGYTRGSVFDLTADVNIEYEDASGNPFMATFENQMIIVATTGKFSDSGDSGSLIVDRATKRATGLLFAGSSTHTIANHIVDVLAALKVTLVV